jgi:hypothetical protein
MAEKGASAARSAGPARRATRRSAQSTAFDVPERLNEWPVRTWLAAIFAFDFGDAEPLGELLRVEAPPPEFRCAVADIVTGRRLQNKKAAAKMKLKPAFALNIGWTALLGIRAWRQLFAHGASPGSGYRNAFEELASAKGIEPLVLRRRLEARSREHRDIAADALEISKESLEKLMREVRRRVDAWPVV